MGEPTGLKDRYLVTGGSGFLGSALVKRLLAAGRSVRVLDDGSRGRMRRLADVADDVDFVAGDVRDPEVVARAAQGVDSILHLAFVNGTEFFYSKPDLVLDVGVRGMLSVLDACRSAGVGELVLASSSEVYQVPPVVPTDETAPLVVPDPLNPRYSYGGGKLISELLALHCGRDVLSRVLIFRPHNVYGPDMGHEHVVPQFTERMCATFADKPGGVVEFPIQGSGTETRSFIYVEDFADAIMFLFEKGEHRGIYHVGTEDEVTIADVAHKVAAQLGRQITLRPGPLQSGSTPRRCPDTTKLRRLGFSPRIPLDAGLARTVAWYKAARSEAA